MNNEEAILARLDGLTARMDRFDCRQEATQKMVVDTLVAVAGLRVKAGVWGAIAGLIPSAILAMYFLTRVMAD